MASWYMLFFQIPQVPEWFLSLNDFATLENSFKGNSKAGTFTDEDIAEFKKSWHEENALTSAINYYRANAFSLFLAKPPKNDTENKLKVPTLFIYGEKDFAILPETVKNVQQAIDAPYTEFRLPEAGHWVQQEAPEEVNLVLRDFLND
jgi:pimeloyl-ACP methyl ester carboxylesterase